MSHSASDQLEGRFVIVGIEPSVVDDIGIVVGGAGRAVSDSWLRVLKSAWLAVLRILGVSGSEWLWTISLLQYRASGNTIRF